MWTNRKVEKFKNWDGEINSESSYSFAGNFANVRRNIGNLIDSFLGPVCKICLRGFLCRFWNSKFGLDYRWKDISYYENIKAVPLGTSEFSSGAPLLGKFGNLSIREILVVTSAYARTYWRRGRGVPRQADGGWRMPSFLGGKSPVAFGQPTLFLAGNRVAIVAFEKVVSLKSLSLFSKTIVRQYWSFKLEKKHLISINGKKKFKRILIEGIRKRAQICHRCSLKYFAMLSRFHSRGRTHDAGSVARIVK